MKTFFLVTLFAFLAVVNCQNRVLFCNFTDNTCTNVAYCNYATIGSCTFTSKLNANAPYFAVSGSVSGGGNVLLYPSSGDCSAGTNILSTTPWTFNQCVNQGLYSIRILADTTPIWSLTYGYNGDSTCTIPGPTGSVALARLKKKNPKKIFT